MELYDVLLLERNYMEIILEIIDVDSNWDIMLPNNDIKNSCVEQYNDKIIKLNNDFKHLYN